MSRESGYFSIADRMLYDSGPKHSTPIKASDKMKITSISASELPHGVISYNTSGLEMEMSALEFDDISSHVNVYKSDGKGDNGTNNNGKQKDESTDSVCGKMQGVCTSECKTGMVVQQRREIGLLVQELKDRDLELTDMVSAHQHQLARWEQDRQLILRLQHKCATLTEQVQQGKKELAVVKAKFDDEDNVMKASDLTFQAKHAELHKSISQSFQKAKHQQELKESKSEDVGMEVKALKAKLKEMELECQHCHEQRSSVIHWQYQYQAVKEQNDRLKVVCEERDKLTQLLDGQLCQTQQHMLALQQALSDSCEREKCQEEIISSLQAQKERMKKELVHLRNLYKRQNREVALLQLSLDSSRESCKDDDTGSQKHFRSWTDKTDMGSSWRTSQVGVSQQRQRLASLEDSSHSEKVGWCHDLPDERKTYTTHDQDKLGEQGNTGREFGQNSLQDVHSPSHPYEDDSTPHVRREFVGSAFQLPSNLLGQDYADKNRKAHTVQSKVFEMSFEENEQQESSLDQLCSQKGSFSRSVGDKNVSVEGIQQTSRYRSGIHSLVESREDNRAANGLNSCPLGQKFNPLALVATRAVNNNSTVGCLHNGAEDYDRHLCGQNVWDSSLAYTGNGLGGADTFLSHQHDGAVREEPDAAGGGFGSRDYKPASTPDRFPGTRSPFDEKLAAYLSSPEMEEDLHDNIGKVSPASKLHRLLYESQEMVRDLEGTMPAIKFA